MQRSQPFARAIAMMAAIASAMAMPHSSLQQAAMAKVGTYESHGKGGKRTPRHVGTKANARAARKARNVRRARAANR